MAGRVHLLLFGNFQSFKEFGEFSKSKKGEKGMHQMEKQNKQKNVDVKKRHGWLVAVIGLLFVAICVTGALLASRLQAHATKDKDIISLVSNVSVASEKESENSTEVQALAADTAEVLENKQETVAIQSSGNKTVSSSKSQQTSIIYVEEEVEEPLHPNFEVQDGTKVWETTTKVDIFKIRYENGEAVVTVDGMGDKLIAPGTGNAYTFCLKNTGDTLLDYTLTMEAYFMPDTQPIPIEVRLKGYNGTYLLGADDSWVDVLELNTVEETAYLRVNRYAYYTLEWQWPFESDDDAYDTFLGNTAVDEDLTLTIVIRTIATGDDMTTQIIQTEQVITGDNGMLFIWIALAASAALLLVILFLYRKSRKN